MLDLPPACRASLLRNGASPYSPACCPSAVVDNRDERGVKSALPPCLLTVVQPAQLHGSSYLKRPGGSGLGVESRRGKLPNATGASTVGATTDKKAGAEPLDLTQGVTLYCPEHVPGFAAASKPWLTQHLGEFYTSPTAVDLPAPLLGAADDDAQLAPGFWPAGC